MAQRWSSVLLCSQNDICVQKMLFFQRTGTEMLKYLYRAYITNPTKVLLHKALLALLGIFSSRKGKKLTGYSCFTRTMARLVCPAMILTQKKCSTVWYAKRKDRMGGPNKFRLRPSTTLPCWSRTMTFLRCLQLHIGRVCWHFLHFYMICCFQSNLAAFNHVKTVPL